MNFLGLLIILAIHINLAKGSLCAICVLPVMNEMKDEINEECRGICELPWPEGRPTKEDRKRWYEAVGGPHSPCNICALPLKAATFTTVIEKCSGVCSRGRLFFEFYPDQ